MRLPMRIPALALGAALALTIARPALAGEALQADQLFSATDLQQQKVDLGTLLKQNKAVLVNFWATWCALCKEEIPQLAALYEAHRAQGIAVVGVNVAESQAKVEAYAGRLGINYPVVLDRDSGIAETYNVVGLPVSVLVHADGTLSGPYSGYTRELVADVEKALQR